jgi:hypothetical protein
MKNIQAQYQDLLEGKMSKSNFMRNVRMQFPQHISPVTSYDDSVKILKGKRILSEAKQPIGVYGHNPSAEAPQEPGIDQLNYYQVYHGIQYELAKMPEITDENYIKARKKVVDAILKDPDAYKDLQLANFKAVKEMDKDLEMKDVKKNNLTDKPNEMKVVKKDEKENTQDTLEKKEKRKSKTAKVPVMTQAPKSQKGVEAFATPGKEKVFALKEHILDELTIPNENKEHLTKGRVKKKDDSKAGEIVDIKDDTATVKWDDGSLEHVQINVLTHKDVPAKKEIPMPSSPRTMMKWSNKEEGLQEDPIGQQAAGDPEAEKEMRDALVKKKVKEALLSAMKKEGYVIQTQAGQTVGSGRDSSKGAMAARDLEKTTGDELTVVDTKTGRKQQA